MLRVKVVINNVLLCGRRKGRRRAGRQHPPRRGGHAGPGSAAAAGHGGAVGEDPEAGRRGLPGEPMRPVQFTPCCEWFTGMFAAWRPLSSLPRLNGTPTTFQEGAGPFAELIGRRGGVRIPGRGLLRDRWTSSVYRRTSWPCPTCTADPSVNHAETLQAFRVIRGLLVTPITTLSPRCKPTVVVHNAL
jgi:hypothetical protein